MKNSPCERHEPSKRPFLGALRFVLAALSCLFGAATALAQTATIGLLVNGAPAPDNEFLLPFGASAQVAITSSIPDAIIFYTTDGSDVGFDSLLYFGSFAVTNTIEVQAFATDQNFDEFTPAITGLIQFVASQTITDTTPGGGTVWLNPPGGVYGNGTVVTLSANPASGWTFANWTGDISGTNPVLSVTLTNNLTVAAVFVTTVDFAAGPANYGSVMASPPGDVYPYGTTLDVSAVPNPGKYFLRWANTNFGAASPITISVTNADIICSALFGTLTATNVSLTLLANGPGTVQAAPVANDYPIGTTITVTATPQPGVPFVGWSGGATGTANPLTLTLTSNTVVTANFGTAAPQIVAQPLSHVVVAGSNATLNVSAIGTQPMNYQWWFNGTNLLSGQTSSNLTLLNAQVSSGRYSVVVSNAVGVVTSSAARISVMTPTIYWTGGGDGTSWSDVNNWNTGLLPSATDSIFIGSGTNTITGLSLGVLNNFICQRPVNLVGSLMIIGAVEIAQGNYSSTITIAANGTNAMFIDEGVTELSEIDLYAQLGAFPGLSLVEYNQRRWWVWPAKCDN